MKVRILNNKIRFRLKEPEVKRLHEEGIVSEVLEFGVEEADYLTFSLTRQDIEKVAVEFVNNHVTVSVPNPAATTWATTEQVGIEEKVDTEKGRIISILIEKDFMCMDGREEDNEGSFPNPLAQEI